MSALLYLFIFRGAYFIALPSIPNISVQNKYKHGNNKSAISKKALPANAKTGKILIVFAIRT